MGAGGAGRGAGDARGGANRVRCAEAEAGGAGGACSQTELWVRSLSVVLLAGRGEACRALVSRARAVCRADARAHTRRLTGRLGALALTDLTPHSALWRDRFRTNADHALTFQYQR